MVNPAVANSALREFSFLNALALEETSVLRVVVETTRRAATRNAEEEIIVGRSVKPAIVAVGVFLAHISGIILLVNGGLPRGIFLGTCFEEPLTYVRIWILPSRFAIVRSVDPVPLCTLPPSNRTELCAYLLLSYKNFHRISSLKATGLDSI